MKISSAQQQLASSHLEFERRTVSERIRVSLGPQAPDAAPSSRAPAGSAPVALSVADSALRQPPAQSPALPAEEPLAPSSEASAISAALEGAENDPMLALLRHMLERMFGIRLAVFDASEMQPAKEQAQASPPAMGKVRFELEYEYREQRSEVETTRFDAAGRVRTAD